MDAILPGEGLIFDYYYSFKQKGMWKYWPDYVRQLKPETGIAVQIPTIDTARYMYMLDLHIKVCLALKFPFNSSLNIIFPFSIQLRCF